MREAQLKQVNEFIALLEEAHDTINGFLEGTSYSGAVELLMGCQNSAIAMGTLIENSEGEGFVTVSYLEEYCEYVYQMSEKLNAGDISGARADFSALKDSFEQAKESVKKDITIRKEVVFFPYKSSMWDSLESVWMAADADPMCDAFVVPIPYFDKNPDGSVKELHYEGNQFPDYVPVVHYTEYNVKERCPDVAYIHNPYDEYNRVTSVAPTYYSKELKKYCRTLVYIPYFCTLGGVGKGQALSPAFFNVDYIATQAEIDYTYYDSRIPKEKFVAVGSPKFDRVINLCKNPPEPPTDWAKKMAGKKVYFYNTSIGGMLGNTETFLKKMKYVFDCFKGVEDACLLWRPHPLLESTFTSMRMPFYNQYLELKEEFLKNEAWIYDDTPTVEEAVAFSDAYVGEEGSSVMVLFAMAGKEVFVLDTDIYNEPAEADFAGYSIYHKFISGSDKWIVTRNNHLYRAKENSFDYEFVTELSEYGSHYYYYNVTEYKGKLYVAPFWGQEDILVLSGDGKEVIKKIPVPNRNVEVGAFLYTISKGKYLFIMPGYYHSMIRLNMETFECVTFGSEFHDFFVNTVGGIFTAGDTCFWGDYLVVSSAIDDKLYVVDINTLEVQLVSVGCEAFKGAFYSCEHKGEIYMLPLEGTSVLRWNPNTGKHRVYETDVDGFEIKNLYNGFWGENYAYTSLAFIDDSMILSPGWGNMFVKVNLNSGKCEEWQPGKVLLKDETSGYMPRYYHGCFTESIKDNTLYRYFSADERCFYDVNLSDGSAIKHEVAWDKVALEEHSMGFGAQSHLLRYACMEDAVNTLSKYLNHGIEGHKYDRKEQIEAYEKSVLNLDGTCGEKLHEYVMQNGGNR